MWTAKCVLIMESRSKVFSFDEFGFLLADGIALSLARCECKSGELERVRHSKKNIQTIALYKGQTCHKHA